MALIKSVRGFTPQIGEDCYLSENATVVGDVVIGNHCSIWFNAVLRGDVNSIRIGNNVNIQDGSVLHTLYQRSTIEIGDYVSVGHNVTIHGARVDDYALYVSPAGQTPDFRVVFFRGFFFFFLPAAIVVFCDPYGPLTCYVPQPC